MADLQITSQVITSTQALIRMSGTVDTVNFYRVEEEFGKVLESSVQGLLLDATKLENVTSAALGSMANLTRIMKDRGGKLVIALPEGEARTLVELLGLKTTLNVYDTLDAARRALSDVK